MNPALPQPGRAGIHASAALALLFAGAPAVLAQKSSPLLLDAANARLLVANADSSSVSIVDTRTDTLIAEIPVGANPQALALAGNRLLVANQDEDTLSVVDLGSGQVQACVPLGDEPAGLVAGAGQLFVTNAAAGTLTVKDLATLDTLAELPMAPEPRGLTLAANGLLYVTHFLSGRISVIDTSQRAVLGVIETGSGAMLSQNVVLDPQSALAYAPQTLANTANESLLFDTTVFPVVAVIDTAQRVNRRGDRIALDIADEPVSIPFDAALLPGSMLYVVNAGSNDVSVVDLATSRAVAHVDVGANPRSIVADIANQRAYVSNTLDGSVTVIDTVRREPLRNIPVTTLPLPAQQLEGKRLFNSANDPALAKDQWIACATCHFDGRHDGRTWFFPDGPRNTPGLAGIAATLPLHWSGDLDELHDVESTVRTIQAGTGLTQGNANCDPACDRAPPNAGRSAALDALAAYMASLEHPVTPLQAQSLGPSLAARRGELLFESSRCASCHVPPRFTDNRLHDVGTGRSSVERKGVRFDTPGLLGIARTPPYLHDGSAATLLDVLKRARDGLHGDTAGLSDLQLMDLQQFLLELPAPVAPAFGAPPCGLPHAGTVQLQISSSRSGLLMRGDRTVVAARVDAPVAADLYLGVIFPDGRFKTLQQDGRFGDFGQIGRAQRTNAEASVATLPLLDFVLAETLPAGTYRLVLISTLAGAEFNRRQHWLDLDTVDVQVAGF